MQEETPLTEESIEEHVASIRKLLKEDEGFVPSGDLQAQIDQFRQESRSHFPYDTAGSAPEAKDPKDVLKLIEDLVDEMQRAWLMTNEEVIARANEEDGWEDVGDLVTHILANKAGGEPDGDPYYYDRLFWKEHQALYMSLSRAKIAAGQEPLPDYNQAVLQQEAE